MPRPLGLEEEKKEEQGKQGRPALIASVVFTIVAMIGLAISVLSANLTDQVRIPVLFSIPLLATGLFVGVLYSPVKRIWSDYKTRSSADRVARENVKILVEFSTRFHRIAAGEYIDTLVFAINEIAGTKEFAVGNLQTHHIQELAASVERLTKDCRSFREFKEISRLLDTTIREFNDRVEETVKKIKTARSEGKPIPEYNLERYRLARLRYIAFIDEWMGFGGKLLAQLGVHPDEYVSPYYVRISHLGAPPEL